jgi:hypothetical protein
VRLRVGLTGQNPPVMSCLNLVRALGITIEYGSEFIGQVGRPPDKDKATNRLTVFGYKHTSISRIFSEFIARFHACSSTDSENEWVSMVDSYVINSVTHSIVHSLSDNLSALISASIRELGSDPFAEKMFLTSITFESQSIVVRFLSSVFHSCSSLESICIPTSFRFIGDNCFLFWASLVSVTFEYPSMLERI